MEGKFEELLLENDIEYKTIAHRTKTRIMTCTNYDLINKMSLN